MRRFAVELAIGTVIAVIMASLVLVAGTVMEASTEPLMSSYALRPALCTVSYCEPPELVLTTTVPDDAPAEAATPLPGED